MIRKKRVCGYKFIIKPNLSKNRIDKFGFFLLYRKLRFLKKYGIIENESKRT